MLASLRSLRWGISAPSPPLYPRPTRYPRPEAPAWDVPPGTLPRAPFLPLILVPRKLDIPARNRVSTPVLSGTLPAGSTQFHQAPKRPLSWHRFVSSVFSRAFREVTTKVTSHLRWQWTRQLHIRPIGVYVGDVFSRAPGSGLFLRDGRAGGGCHEGAVDQLQLFYSYWPVHRRPMSGSVDTRDARRDSRGREADGKRIVVVGGFDAVASSAAGVGGVRTAVEL